MMPCVWPLYSMPVVYYDIVYCIFFFFVVPSPIMQCSYVVDVAVHVPWAPDIEVRQPLLIKPPPNIVVSQLEPLPCNTVIYIQCHLHTQWESWHPPSWVAYCRQAPVTGSCAVPPDVLSKSHDNHMAFAILLILFYFHIL